MIKLTDLINEGLNENRPPTPRDVKNWIESFNNAVWLKRASGYFLFKASKFALEGIKRELKGHDVRVASFPKGAYGIPVSQKNNFHWGTNESLTENKFVVYYKENPNDAKETLHKVVNSSSQAKRELRKLEKGKDTYDYHLLGFAPIDQWESWYGSIDESQLNEGSHKTYFNSFTEAAEEAAKVAEKQGYQIDEDDWFRQVGTGGRYSRSRPSIGDTHRFTVELHKRGKPARQALHFQVYGMKSGKYELNAYVS